MASQTGCRGKNDGSFCVTTKFRTFRYTIFPDLRHGLIFLLYFLSCVGCEQTRKRPHIASKMWCKFLQLLLIVKQSKKNRKDEKRFFSVSIQKGRCYILKADDEETKTEWLNVLPEASQNLKLDGMFSVFFFFFSKNSSWLCSSFSQRRLDEIVQLGPTLKSGLFLVFVGDLFWYKDGALGLRLRTRFSNLGEGESDLLW